ncbi:hypothetical protein F3Y22_tig00109972pilonHSYRG00023 [Hibiscus syriacus]|uniref:Uncharacterized protein n=1 Tax=Hibiscus syriacus TaxID=106335 RepID=A0A6A3BW21_HIBSY|nr:hypothetical protein F3Y22_tig00109972pilonHSYRG00023 [Hibiscus syriacus]
MDCSKLLSISVLLPLEKATLLTSEGEKSIDLAGRIGQGIAALLRRIGLPYQGNESYGNIRINGLALRRWFQPKLASPFTGKPRDIHLFENKGSSVLQIEYAKVIGSLMFLMNYTRPDIAYAVSILIRYTHNPSGDHWFALRHSLKYLKGTMDWRLEFVGYPVVLEGYCYAN